MANIVYLYTYITISLTSVQNLKSDEPQTCQIFINSKDPDPIEKQLIDLATIVAKVKQYLHDHVIFLQKSMSC